MADAKTTPTAERVGHTPGPWAKERCEHTPEYYVAAGAYPFGTTVCSVNEKPKQGTPEANARLIAAAPDLLEALLTLVSCGDDYFPTALDAAARAIAKATGQEARHGS